MVSFVVLCGISIPKYAVAPLVRPATGNNFIKTNGNVDSLSGPICLPIVEGVAYSVPHTRVVCAS